MKRIAFLSAAAVLALHLGARADSVIVISHPSLTLPSADVGSVFLGEKEMAGSVKLTPVDNGSQQDAFLGKFLNMELAKYKSAWAKKAFRDGLSAPAVKGGDADVVDFVKKTPGAVGYVKGPPPAGVNVVTQK